MQEQVLKRLEDLIIKYPALSCERNAIFKAYQVLENSLENHGKILIAGNGGSAADAEHIVGELMKGFVKKRKIDKEFALALQKEDKNLGEELAEKLQGAIPAIALNGHTALSTAFLNDVDAKLSFAQQVNGYGVAGDVFWGISTSGNSANVLYAAITAKAKRMKVIALTGRDGGGLKNIADVSIIVPESETFRIQELHLPVYHVLCLMLEEHFFE